MIIMMIFGGGFPQNDFQNALAIRGVLNFYSGGVITHDRK
jgi:hypothetical protein